MTKTCVVVWFFHCLASAHSILRREEAVRSLLRALESEGLELRTGIHQQLLRLADDPSGSDESWVMYVEKQIQNWLPLNLTLARHTPKGGCPTLVRINDTVCWHAIRLSSCPWSLKVPNPRHVYLDLSDLTGSQISGFQQLLSCLAGPGIAVTVAERIQWAIRPPLLTTSGSCEWEKVPVTIGVGPLTHESGKMLALLAHLNRRAFTRIVWGGPRTSVPSLALGQTVTMSSFFWLGHAQVELSWPIHTAAFLYGGRILDPLYDTFELQRGWEEGPPPQELCSEIV